MPRSDRVTPKLAALGCVLVAVVVVGLALRAFQGDFDRTVTVIVESDRAGLTTAPGALVKLHGVEVGRVGAVHATESGATIELELREAAAPTIPANVGADIESGTVFGAKVVSLRYPDEPAAAPITHGARITADAVTVEINSVFESLTAVLRVVDPPQLNATLESLAAVLRDNGTVLGETLVDVESVSAHLEPALPDLRLDLVTGADTTEVLADAAGPLMDTLDRLTTTADTLTSRADRLDSLLLSVTGLSETGAAVLAENTDPLLSAIAQLRPTSRLLAEYAPMFPCFLQGADRARLGAEPLSGGNGQSQRLNSTFLFGTDSYVYPADLPVVAATGGPRCGPLPHVTEADLPVPYLVANTGANPFARGNTGPVLPGSIREFLLGSSVGGSSVGDSSGGSR